MRSTIFAAEHPNSVCMYSELDGELPIDTTDGEKLQALNLQAQVPFNSTKTIVGSHAYQHPQGPT